MSSSPGQPSATRNGRPVATPAPRRRHARKTATTMRNVETTERVAIIRAVAANTESGKPGNFRTVPRSGFTSVNKK